jgi:hypothetical protein
MHKKTSARKPRALIFTGSSISELIKLATVAEMVQPIDCKREAITRSSTPGID